MHDGQVSIRAAEPEAAFRSSFIVGFPGETESDHVELLGFLEAAALDWAGLFAFSPEDGTAAADLDGTVDEGVNGFDDDGNGLVDDAAEQETSAPYPVPLRGIEIRIRCYEPSSRQVRQVTVRHSFVPR